MLILFFFAEGALAQGLIEGISGSWESTYTFLNSTTTDAFGNTIKINTQSFIELFQLDVNTNIFPNLTLRAGGVVRGQWAVFDDKTDNITTRTILVDLNPYFDLTLQTPLYKVDVGYLRRQGIVDVFNVSKTTLISNEYYTILGWWPEGLPSIDAQIRWTNLFDSQKTSVDVKESFISLNPQYRYEGLLLQYYGTFLHTRNDLIDLDVWQNTHQGRASYTGSFFSNRVALNTNYNILSQETTTQTTGKGFVSTQVFAFAGLSRVDDILTPVTLDPNPALIDANTTASAGIDLVSTVPLTKRQMGLDFLNPTDVNQLFVWVDRELTPAIVTSFSWQLFTSNDNLTWVPKAIINVVFGTFENRFEISFSTVTTRYIKVVTTPLLRNPLVPTDIFVTELQAFIQVAAADVKGKISRTTQLYDLDVKTRILDTPFLFYELYYFYNRLDSSLQSGQSRYDLINSLSANQRFSEVFSAKAKVGIENSTQFVDQRSLTYFYDASVIADPLRTLHNTLTFYGRNEEINGRPNDTNSILLYNTAQLYPGVDINLNGGVVFRKQETGESGRDFLINFQANIVPNRKVTLGINYSNIISRRTGGVQGSTSTTTQTLDVTLSYNPFRTLNLFAFVEYISETGQKGRVLQNYAINWSPFPDGALQFNITYNENFRTDDHLVERIFQPNIRYNFSKRSYVEFSYQLIRSRSDIENIRSNLWSTTVKLFF